jgi:lipid II:glycine glycyltransferase (peptidoglycan interpeptide bridge formation enzyme)
MSISFSEVKSKNEWDTFVQSQPFYSFLHSWEWGEFNKMQGNEIIRLGMRNGSTLKGVALLLGVKARRGQFLFCPHGPLMDWRSYGECKKFIKYIRNLGKTNKFWFLRFSPLIDNGDLESQSVLREMDFRPAPIHMHAEETWLLDITPVENDLLMGARKGTRNLIRRSAKEGVKIVQSQRIEDFEYFEALYKDTATRHDFVPYSPNYLRQEFEIFVEHDQANLFFAEYNGEYISGAMILYYGKIAFYHHGASTSKYRKIPANHGLQWASILEAKKRGCHLYNFWGIAPEGKKDHPWNGLTFFKQGFGGYRIDFMHAQDFVISPRYWVTFWVETTRRKRRGF